MIDIDWEKLKLESLANFGFTGSGAAIVDAVWFSGANCNPASQIGMVLICNPAGVWKAYIGALDILATEKIGAQIIADNGAKVSCAIALAAFPNRFTAEEYDMGQYLLQR